MASPDTPAETLPVTEEQEWVKSVAWECERNEFNANYIYTHIHTQLLQYNYIIVYNTIKILLLAVVVVVVAVVVSIIISQTVFWDLHTLIFEQNCHIVV